MWRFGLLWNVLWMSLWVEELRIFCFLRGLSVLPVKGIEIRDDYSGKSTIGAIVFGRIIEEVRR